MFQSEIKTFSNNDEMQRVQFVSFDSWEKLNFFIPEYSDEGLKNLVEFYSGYMIRKYGQYLGKIIMYRLPDDYKLPDSFHDDSIFDKTVLLTKNFNKNIRYRNGKVIFKDSDTRDVYNDLESRGLLKFIKGKRSYLYLMPVSDSIGLLSQSNKESKLKVNASFFTFDCLDIRSIYDKVGIPVGLALKDGKIINPPMFDREALFVDENDEISIFNIDLKDIEIEIDSKVYVHGKNAFFYTRPKYYRTYRGGTDIVIVNNKVVAINNGGNTKVPSGGFVIQTDSLEDIKDLNVTYHGLEKYKFGLQVGNSVIINGKKTLDFRSSFYNFKKLVDIPYPPAMYPLDYVKARAPRIVLGADMNNKPVIIWFEGAAKTGHIKGEESEGVSLKEVADICESYGIYNGINLDGGGSAQILIDNKKALNLSDRDDNLKERERAVSLSLFV